MKLDAKLNACEIVEVERRRDGGMRYWCLAHRADATAKYGRRAGHCTGAAQPGLADHEILKIHLRDYPGGVGIWGCALPVYDTTSLPLESGVHVHARKSPAGRKDIDATFRAVRVHGDGKSAQINGDDAICFLAASIFGKPMKYIECSHCRHPHLDKDWFSVNTHQKHLCMSCGRIFRDSERGIGNPAVRLREMFGGLSRPVPAKRKGKFRQADFGGGLQIWASNPAIVWTVGRGEEEGVHLHAYDKSGRLVEDDTFSSLEIDGISLHPDSIRLLMAQRSLPHIAPRVALVTCETCQSTILSERDEAFTPQRIHRCNVCSGNGSSRGRYRNVVANPALFALSLLAARSPLPIRKFELPRLNESRAEW